jgi:ribosomal protein L7/L12
MPDETPSDPTPAEGMFAHQTPADLPPTSGWRGWLQRRAEVQLRKPGRASAALAEPGEYQVVLQVTGASTLRVMAVIREATGLDVMSAGDLAKEAPVVVVSGISQTSADRVVERLQKAGAKAVVGETYRPQ